MGQKTGTSKMEKKVMTNATQKALVMAYLAVKTYNGKVNSMVMSQKTLFH